MEVLVYLLDDISDGEPNSEIQFEILAVEQYMFSKVSNSQYIVLLDALLQTVKSNLYAVGRSYVRNRPFLSSPSKTPRELQSMGHLEGTTMIKDAQGDATISSVGFENWISLAPDALIISMLNLPIFDMPLFLISNSNVSRMTTNSNILIDLFSREIIKISGVLVVMKAIDVGITVQVGEKYTMSIYTILECEEGYREAMTKIVIGALQVVAKVSAYPWRLGSLICLTA
ncbi:hypothetical protein RF11_07378 [Thelohanellus kitauei]|uniref:Uncharacterized protein n=1 Tax=Thelohanellus kitauei TaxID=669202 RepID=A0A0C2M0U9_THEKT|nr:hypothetical protein RF11_07378 [Thelohanellus kitauei]